MLRINKNEIWSIPNILGYFRILLIPAFTIVFLNAKSNYDYHLVAALVVLSGITDLLDGFIARKFNMVTNLGKFVDPLADKLTQTALAICLATRYRWLWALVVLFVLKEGFMMIVGYYFFKRGTMLDGARWFGKICTAFLYAVMVVLLIFPNISMGFANALIAISAALTVFALAMYIPIFVSMKKDMEKI